MRFKPPREVFVEQSVAEEPLVSMLKEKLPRAAYHFAESIPDKIRTDPRTLEVVRFRGRFLKACPGTRHYNCCGYRILHFGTGCSLGCTYCVLQAYLSTPNLRLFGNITDCFPELDQELLAHPGSLFRIGTGEFTDSLLLDPWTGFSRRLIDYFARRPNAVLELKTKTH
ncbi:MAG: DNA photolyase, partial [Syntrophobacteraceae bacterium]|nr:DNA photolyase [Syntrophobacteraceae bacterium]